MSTLSKAALIAKYDQAAPRYTSYPTAPYWTDQPPAALWLERAGAAMADQPEISLYIHLPYCERLCTYCGCNKRITRNHAVERPYIDTVLAEWSLYLQALPGRPVLRELHLGGGTPTFFAPENLRVLVEGILQTVEVPVEHFFSFEAHPNSTTEAHVATLAELGFNRLSIGVQDFDPFILGIINRRQTLEDVERTVRLARRYGYTSINFDLIYGLPHQTPDHIRRNLAEVARLRPERIAFYSYAHVPWIKPAQRAYSEADLPAGEAKRALYDLACELFQAQGYTDIGMDHFALPQDELSTAYHAGTLHRNFMGYTPFHTRLSIGLGASSISDSWDVFVQNERTVEAYLARVRAGELPLLRGHLLTDEDQLLRRIILDLMCRGAAEWSFLEDESEAIEAALHRLEPMAEDGLVRLGERRVEVLPEGLPFLRNVCMAFDARFWAKRPEGELFSKVI